MISLAQHHYSPMFSPLPSDVRSYSGSPHSSTSQRIQTSGLENIVTSGGNFNIQSPTQRSIGSRSGVGPALKSPTRARHHPYEAMDKQSRDSRSRTHDGSVDTKANGAPIRRRISRACDQCNQLRTKCDGMSPCAHCVEFSLSCEYFRERKKRGKASRKDIAAQQAAAAAAVNPGTNGSNQPPSPSYSSEDPASATSNSNHAQDTLKGTRADLPPPPPPGPLARTMSGTEIPHSQNGPHDMSRANAPGMMPEHVHLGQAHPPQPPRSNMPEGLAQMNGFELVPDYQRQQMGMPPIHAANGELNGHVMPQLPQQMDTTPNFHYGDPSFQLMSPHDAPPNPFPFARQIGGSPITNFMAGSPVGSSPGWLPLPSPTSGPYGARGIAPPPSTSRYPVLQPLIPKLSSILPTSLACDLLELYFASSSSAHIHPLSPYLLGFVFRKRSFLHPTRPRACSPALLASMLWVSAQTSDAPFLTSPPQARGRVCQKLLELTVSLLRPLIHGNGDGAPAFATNTVVNGVALGGLGVATNIEQLTSETGGTGTLDDVATYLHLATVISASEHKAASMRWWNVAWSLARELKLGRELPPNAPQRDRGHDGEDDADGDVDLEMNDANVNQNGVYGASASTSYTEEEREERRRIWWLLYTVDRHLALCYNRPLFLLDAECYDLLQPVSDSVWQADEFYTGDSSLFPDPTSKPRHRGPSYECTSHSIFGFFTPLMTILGEIVELNQARNHPRFGLTFRSASEWDNQSTEITQHLNIYERSLKEFENRTTSSLHAEQEAERAAEVGTPSVRSVRSANTSSSRITESMIHTKTVIAYGTHVMHVLHILLTGKWDPITLLDDSDLWISSESFIFATQHAVSGAEAVSQILEYDPDLSFMPFFFGIYLLQGSFLLLLIADKLQGEASQSVVGACEVIIRAVEACVVTLNTEYQRNFRKVLRSALAQVKGRIPEDFGEQQQRRREVLSLYRWTGDGTGLAL